MNNVKSEKVCDLAKITNLITCSDLHFEDVNVYKHAKNGKVINIDK